MRVMYVDDDSDDHFLFAEIMKDAFPTASLIEAYDGQQALDYLNDRSNPLPDQIFLDINMPLVNGIQCLTAIRKSPLLSTIPVTIVTTGLTPREAATANELKASVVLKQSNYDLFRAAVAQAIFVSS